MRKAREETQKTLVLSGKTNGDEYDQIPESIVCLDPLSHDQIEALAKDIDVAVTSEEIVLLKKYSMGVPRLLKQMMEHRPLQEHQAVQLLKTYVLGQVQTHNLYYEGEIDEFLLRELFVTLPPDLEIDELRKGNYKGEWKTYFYRLAMSDEPHNIPRCQDTLGHYDQWYESLRNGEAFHNGTALFAPDTDGKLEELGEILGTPANNFGNGRLNQYETHKTWWYHSGAAFGGEGKGNPGAHINYWLRLADMGGGVAQRYSANEEVEATSDKQFFFLSSGDHFDRFKQPFYVAYNAELVLQGLEIGYYISHSGKGYYYDPKQNQYREITEEEKRRVDTNS